MRFVDLIDQAQELEALQRDDAIERARWHGHGSSAEACERCGGEIPEVRRRALPGVVTCVGCAAALERVAATKKGAFYAG